MTYTINKTDGNELTKIPDGTFDTNSTALTLIGRNVVSFGEALNENFVKLLENFASATAPENAIKGQIWFDSVNNRLNVFDGTSFRASGGPQVGPRVPDPLTTGDLWINNETNQIWFYDGTDLILIGPVYTAAQGVTGFKVETVIDIDSISHSICQVFVKNILIGIFSSTAFVPKFAIAGYGVLGKPVRIGFNAADLAGMKFDVTVTRSESILLDDGVTAKTATELVFTNIENTFTEKTSIQNNAGIELGATSQVKQYLDANNFYIENQIANKSVNINVKSGASTVTGITVAGNGQRVGIFNQSPTATLDVAGDVKISGNLQIGGDTTTVNTTVLDVEDKNLTLGSTSAPTDITADGGGITLKGTTDKSITYNRVDQSWDMSENLKLASGKTFSIGGDVIIAPSAPGEYTLGAAVTVSSLVGVGNLTLLQMAGTNGIRIDQNSITTDSGSIIINPSQNISVSDKKIQNLALPVAQTDATNKAYVDEAVYRRGFAMSMDITGMDIGLLPGQTINDKIIEQLTQIAPFYVPDGTPEQQEGIAVNGTVLKLHCTSTSVSNADIVYSPTVLNGNFTKETVLSSDGVTPVEVMKDMVTGQIIPPPAATVTVTRQNKRFVMTSGAWVFAGDF